MPVDPDVRRQLREVAEAATGGRWNQSIGSDGEYIWTEDGSVLVAAVQMGSDREGHQTFLDARHIAAFDPPTAELLLDALDEADRMPDRAMERRLVEIGERQLARAEAAEAERDRLAEALAVAREAMTEALRWTDSSGDAGQILYNALARIGTLTAPQGEPT